MLMIALEVGKRVDCSSLVGLSIRGQEQSLSPPPRPPVGSTRLSIPDTHVRAPLTVPLPTAAD